MANGAPREHYETFDCSTMTRRLRGNLTCGGLQRFSKECGNEFLKSRASDMAGVRPRTHLSE